MASQVDGIPSLDDAPRAQADEVDYLNDDEAVFGLAWGGEALAFPLRVLDWHEMANDRLAGVPFALAYCTLCGAAVAYSTARKSEGGPHRFGSSGLLMRSNKLMFDRRTWSLWSQLTGEPVVGPLAESGERLDVLPVVATTWGAWRKMHPNTESVTLETGVDRRYEPGAAYGSYFAQTRAMFPAIAGRSDRGELHGVAVADKEQLFLVRSGEVRSVVRVRDVATSAGGVLHATLGDQPIVLVGAVQPVCPLPTSWHDALDENVDDCASLSPADAVRLLERADCFEALRPSHLLAMRPETRFAVFDAYGPDQAEAPHRLDRATRDAVAVQALATPVRAYALRRGVGSFSRVAGQLVDASGRVWSLESDALRSRGEEPLPRLPGHLVFGLGWRAFLAGPENLDSR